MDNKEVLAKNLGIKFSQVEAVLNLLSEGATIPFIARYRKEATGSLDEEQIRSIEKEYTYKMVKNFYRMAKEMYQYIFAEIDKEFERREKAEEDAPFYGR